MPRINIEDKLYRDKRWLKLLVKTGCEYKSLGMITSAWMIAQACWLKHKCVPKKAWPKDLDLLIEVELATKDAAGNVYVKGSKRAFSWLEQRSLAGKAGGKSKSRKKSEASIRNLKSNINDLALSGSQRNATERNGTQPLSLSLSLKEKRNFVSKKENKIENNYHLENDSDCQKFENQFAAEFQEILKTIETLQLRDLKKSATQIFKYFQTAKNFESFLNEVSNSKKAKTLNAESLKRYLIVSAKKEVGAFRESFEKPKIEVEK